MAQNITTGTATTVAANAYAIFIQVNAALTGTIVIAVAGSTQYVTTSATIATITNPTAGSQFKYGGLNQQGAVTVTPSTTCDISVTILTSLK
jgi:hypothetical protein